MGNSQDVFIYDGLILSQDRSIRLIILFKIYLKI
jgi:hypothetical protein